LFGLLFEMFDEQIGELQHSNGKHVLCILWFKPATAAQAPQQVLRD
jgi:hypothetical protein